MEIPGLEAKKLTVGFETDTCTLFLVDGADSASLCHALDARFSLNGRAFFLTLPGSNGIVPLTASLGDGLALTLNVRPALAGVVASAAPVAASQEASAPSAPFLFPAGQQEVPAPCAPKSLPVDQRTNSPRAAPLLQQVEAQPSPRNRAERLEALSGSVQMNEIPQHPSLTRHGSIASGHMGTGISRSMSEQQLADTAQAIDRCSRLSTDLANERTLLAWTRTGMAAMRTALAFKTLEIKDLGLLVILSHEAARLSMALVFISAAILGVIRYKRIKDITYTYTIPDVRFGRLSIHYFTVLVIVGTLALLAAQLADSFFVPQS